jgi:hypothetical protein
MDDLQLIAELLAKQPTPSSHVVASARARMTGTGRHWAGITGSGRRPTPPRHGRPGPARIGLGLVAGMTAAAAATAAILAGGTGNASRPAPSGHDGQLPVTAQQILLTAAAHVVSGPVTGTYWRTSEISGELLPAGTKAHPYDIMLPISYDLRTAPPPGRREWSIYQTRGAAPATTADAAAWRAAGSPMSWSYPKDTITTKASPPGATWQISDGTVGFVQGDEPGLTAAQFRAMPADRAGLLARLRHYALLTWCGRHPEHGCSTVDQLIWGEAVNLLEDPVTSQVRAGAYRVMAALPGVRLLGKMSDTLGRTGYGFGMGQSAPGSVAVIDSRTGSLLAVEAVGPASRIGGCPAGRPAGRGKAPSLPRKCDGPLYYGRSYRGQVDGYEALVSEGWTNTRPVLPPRSAWLGPNGQKG